MKTTKSIIDFVNESFKSAIVRELIGSKDIATRDFIRKLAKDTGRHSIAWGTISDDKHITNVSATGKSISASKNEDNLTDFFAVKDGKMMWYINFDYKAADYANNKVGKRGAKTAVTERLNQTGSKMKWSADYLNWANKNGATVYGIDGRIDTSQGEWSKGSARAGKQDLIKGGRLGDVAKNPMTKSERQFNTKRVLRTITLLISKNWSKHMITAKPEEERKALTAMIGLINNAVDEELQMRVADKPVLSKNGKQVKRIWSVINVLAEANGHGEAATVGKLVSSGSTEYDRINESNYGDVIIDDNDIQISSKMAAWSDIEEAYNRANLDSFIQGYFGGIEFGGHMPTDDDIDKLDEIIEEVSRSRKTKLIRKRGGKKYDRYEDVSYSGFDSQANKIAMLQTWSWYAKQAEIALLPKLTKYAAVPFDYVNKELAGYIETKKSTADKVDFVNEAKSTDSMTDEELFETVKEVRDKIKNGYSVSINDFTKASSTIDKLKYGSDLATNTSILYRLLSGLKLKDFGYEERKLAADLYNRFERKILKYISKNGEQFVDPTAAMKAFYSKENRKNYQINEALAKPKSSTEAYQDEDVTSEEMKKRGMRGVVSEPYSDASINHEATGLNENKSTMKLEKSLTDFVNEAKVDQKKLAELLFAEVKKQKDTDDIEKSDVANFIKEFVESNPKIKIEMNEELVDDFFDSWDH